MMHRNIHGHTNSPSAGGEGMNDGGMDVCQREKTLEDRMEEKDDPWIGC